MRIELPRETERFGANIFFSSEKVFELDSGPGIGSEPQEEGTVVRLPYEALYEVETEMAIVVPVRGEPIKLIEGVLFGIPNQCLIIVVSNSPRKPVDRFRMEVKAIEAYSRITRRNIVVVHQKDPVLAAAFAEAGYDHVLDETQHIRSGKAEGMLLATLLAHAAGKKYVGFVDSDNYFPGAVYEYVQEFAAGFILSESPYSMVRIAWHSKPKIVSSKLYFPKWGRASIVTNRILNRLISLYTRFETDVITTGNAGEHAVSVDLALRLDYSTGYSIEPFHFVSLLEKFGGIRPSPYPEVMLDQVEVHQIESRNPHLHESRGEDHVFQMIEAALGVVYHSFVCPDALKEEIRGELKKRDIIGEDDVPRRPISYPAPVDLDVDAFAAILHDLEHARIIEA